MKNHTSYSKLSCKAQFLKMPANDNPDPAEAIMGDTNALEAGLMAASFAGNPQLVENEK